jgi:hypothetical protein
MATTLQDYLDQHLSPDTPKTEQDPVYMESKKIYDDLAAGNGLLAVDNLVKLSPEGLEELKGRIEARVLPQLERDAVYYAAEFLARNVTKDVVVQHIIDNGTYDKTLVMMTMHDRYALGDATAEQTLEAMNGAIDEFAASASESIQKALEIKAQVAELAVELAERGPAALAYHKDTIDALPDAAQTELREATQVILDGMKEEHPDTEEQVEAFEAILDRDIARLPVAPPAASPTAPAPGWAAPPPTAPGGP